MPVLNLPKTTGSPLIKFTFSTSPFYILTVQNGYKLFYVTLIIVNVPYKTA